MNPPFLLPFPLISALFRSGRVVAGHLLRFTAQGRAEASPVSVNDDDGDINVPGKVVSAHLGGGDVQTFFESEAEVQVIGHRNQTEQTKVRLNNGVSVSRGGDEGDDEHTAIFAVSGTNGGFLPPRMTQAQRLAIDAPATGLMVFETDTQRYWHYISGGWVRLAIYTEIPGPTFPPPAMTTLQRDAIADPSSVRLIYNITSSRLELYTGAAWLGLVTEV